METALGKRPYLSIFGNRYATKDGTGIRDYVHVTDLAEAFYQQSNVLNPFDFDPNESTLSGYNLGFEVSSGMTLVYKNRTTYVLQENGNYDSVSSMQIETQIKL